jgi:hypothetical protein
LAFTPINRVDSAYSGVKNGHIVYRNLGVVIMRVILNIPKTAVSYSAATKNENTPAFAGLTAMYKSDVVTPLDRFFKSIFQAALFHEKICFTR